MINEMELNQSYDDSVENTTRLWTFGRTIGPSDKAEMFFSVLVFSLLITKLALC